ALRLVLVRNGRIAQYAWRLFAGKIGALAANPARVGIAPERRPYRSLCRWRKRRLSHLMQRALRCSGRKLLCPGRTHQSEYPGTIAQADANGGARYQDRGPAAKPGLRYSGDPSMA